VWWWWKGLPEPEAKHIAVKGKKKKNSLFQLPEFFLFNLSCSMK